MLNDPRGQEFPDDPSPETLGAHRIASVVKSLDANRKPIARWFWKGLLAFNLVLGSLIAWTVIVPRLVP